MRFIDIHCHILPGIDDGPESLEMSLRMIKIAADDGISHIFATPHIIKGVYDNNTQKIRKGIEALRLHISEKITIYTGADVRITPDIMLKIEKGEMPTLNGSKYMLIELPHFVIPPNIDMLIFDLRKAGIIPIITHPERHITLTKKFFVLKRLRDIGAMYQLTAMSVSGELGKNIQKISFSMIDGGFIDFIASDAHNARERPPVLSNAYNVIVRSYGYEAAETIFLKNPEKILSCESIESKFSKSC